MSKQPTDRIETLPQLLRIIKERGSIKKWHGEKNRTNCVYHIRDVVDDRIITRKWNWRRRDWDYEAHVIEFFEAHMSHGSLYYY